MLLALDRLSRWCARLTDFAVLVLAIVLILSLLIAIFFRYAVGQALSWPEELSMLLFTWLVLLTGSVGVRDAFHVRLSLVLKRFPPSVQNVMDRLITLSIIGFGVVLFYSGWDMVTRTVGNLSATIGYPLEIINSAAPVCGALIVIHGLYRLLCPRTEKEG